MSFYSFFFTFFKVLVIWPVLSTKCVFLHHHYSNTKLNFVFKVSLAVITVSFVLLYTNIYHIDEPMFSSLSLSVVLNSKCETNCSEDIKSLNGTKCVNTVSVQPAEALNPQWRTKWWIQPRRQDIDQIVISVKKMFPLTHEAAKNKRRWDV